MLGAVALLIWGLRMVRTSIERGFPVQIERAVAAIGDNRVCATVSGAAAGAAMQSGTAGVTLAANLAERGRMQVPVALAAALGADFGSTIAASFLSLDVGVVAYLLIFAGVVLFMASSSRQSRGAGRGILGLGLIFLAVLTIRDTSAAAHGSATALAIVETLESDPALAILLGAILSLIAFSSIAALLLLIQLSGQGVIGFDAAVFLLIGANAGAGFLPLLACLGLAGPGKLVCLSNLMARLFFAMGAAVFVLAAGAEVLRLASNSGMALLLVHGGLNLLLVAVCLWFTPGIAALARAVRPVSAEAPAELARAVYLDENELVRPDRALSNCTRELMRAAETVHEMLIRSMDAFQQDQLIAEIRANDEIVDTLHAGVTSYISSLMRRELSDEQANRARALFDFSTNLEHIGDIIDHNLMDLALSKKKKGVTFSKEGWRELSKLHAALVGNFRLALDVVIGSDPEAAKQLLVEKRRFRAKAIKSQSKHFDRLLEGRAESIGSSVLHLDILRDLRRVSSHLSAAAYPVLDVGGGRI